MLIQLFSSISVNSGFQNIRLHASHVGEYSATIHLDFREIIVNCSDLHLRSFVQIFKIILTQS